MRTQNSCLKDLQETLQSVKDLDTLCKILAVQFAARSEDMLKSGDFTEQPFAEFMQVIMPGEPASKTRMVQILKSKRLQKISIGNLRNAVIRDSLIVIYEFVKREMIRRGLFKKLKHDAWFQLISISRNVCTHGGIKTGTREHPRFDKSGVISWNGIVITKETIEDEVLLEQALLTPMTVWKLIDGAILFWKRNLPDMES